MRSVTLSYKTGCFLPLLIILNFFLGWLFFGPVSWLLIGVILILLFTINSYIMVKKTAAHKSTKKNVIDIDGKIVEDQADKKV